MSALRKVLVVDDDPVVGESFNRVLTGKGYAVITAANGEEALAKLRDEKYDLVYTDLRMPGMDGLEVAERVKAKQPWTPVVIVTGYGSHTSEERAYAAGVSDFLNKPLSPEMIEDSAARALAHAPLPAPAAAAVAAAAVPEAAPAAARKPNVLKNMLLFLMAPFVGLVYAVLLPFVGIGMLAWVALKKEPKQATPAQPE
ncbi:response regulator [Ramlibacter sp. RBP-2]|uniref:Response regulator n=1 Tax=Ramlibacter lithotrophicus TaxID=2606681 RepID=A0A7X6DIU8_9BURK|nr:response regulator [Ramlibacter lithotrophicus]NKE67833.1 response regulator [Ramlibacter lithotrophicus]